MSTISKDDILFAVEKRSRQNDDYRRRLRKALKNRDEYELAELIRSAVKRVLGITLDVAYEIIRYIIRNL